MKPRRIALLLFAGVCTALMSYAVFVHAAAAQTPKGHIKTDGQECSMCHAGEDSAWQSGKHGLMNVKCVVCHRSTDANFIAKPGIDRCAGCHGELVDQLKRMPAAAHTTCFTCHDNHSLTVKNQPPRPFHDQGGK